MDGTTAPHVLESIRHARLPFPSGDVSLGGIEGANLEVHEDLGQAGARLNAYAEEIAEMLQHLATLLQPLEATWDGTAAVWFDGLRMEWNLAANRLLGPTGVLGEIAQAAHVTWVNYVDAEGANALAWKH